MENPNIQKGVITEKQLVELFGSDAQKRSYAENGRFVGNYKNAIFKKIDKYCKIEECGKENNRRLYKITDVYRHSLPANFSKMNKSLYRYIVPLLLNKLVDGHDENNKIDITIGKWAREISMVNRNYGLVKYNREDASRETHYPISVINEFYNKTDDMIHWYITNAFEYLKSAELVIWRKAYRINREISSRENVIDEKGNVKVDISIDSHQASKEEIEYYSQCIAVADKIAKIENANERYYSKKAKHFSEALKRELYKRAIKCAYKTYEACYISLDECKFVLNQFGKLDTDSLIKEFNREFTDMIIGNAEKRFEKYPDRYLSYASKDDYVGCFQDLCEITVDKDTEYLGNRIREKTISDEYTLQITQSKIG